MKSIDEVKHIIKKDSHLFSLSMKILDFKYNEKQRRK